MARRYLPVGIAVGSTLLISLLILFGPGLEKQTKDPLVLDTTWSEIAYEPGPDAAENSSSNEKDKADKKKENKTPENYLPKRFIRSTSFFSEEYFIESAANKAAGPPERRRGNYSVRNIFSDWSKLRYTASYQVPEADLAKYGPFREKIRLQKSSETVVVSVGRKMPNGNQVIVVDSASQKGTIYMIAGHLADRFHVSPLSFREKRILTYPTDSFTQKIEVTRKTGTPPSVWYRSEKFTKDNQPLFKWFDMKGREVPVNVATPLDNAVKLIEVSRFRDESEVSTFGDIEKLWESSGDSEVQIRVALKKGSDYSLQLRKPKEPLTHEKRSYALLRSNVETGTDYIDANVMTSIEQQLVILENYTPPAQSTQGGPNASPASKAKN